MVTLTTKGHSGAAFFAAPEAATTRIPPKLVAHANSRGTARAPHRFRAQPHARNNPFFWKWQESSRKQQKKCALSASAVNQGVLTES